MGCGSSSQANAVDSGSRKRKRTAEGGSKGSAPQPEKAEPEHPDLGLSGSHELVQFLGRGGTGDTWLFKDKATGEDVAIKLVKRPVPKVIQPNLLREIRIQADLGEGHVNIIQAKEALLTDHHLALVMEYAACGSLTTYVTEKWQTAQHSGLFCSEEEARYFFRQFISAVEYCHSHFVAHRDLKLDNTLLDKDELGEGFPPMIKLCDFGFAKGWTADANMFTHIGDLKLDNTLLSDDEPPLLKLCDFGFAREMQADVLLYTHIGTPVYMAPELIHSRNGEHGYDGKQVDVWASGILLIVMLLGTFPYDHVENPDPNTSEAHEEVWKQQTGNPWEKIPHIEGAVKRLSEECRDLLNKIFVTDESQRITVAEIKQHAWFNKPLAGLYSEAEERIQWLQKKHDEYTSSRRISAKMLKRRNEELKQMLDDASKRPTPRDKPVRTPHTRIDLREQLILDNPASYSQTEDAEMPGITEDSEGELRSQQSNLKAIMNGSRA